MAGISSGPISAQIISGNIPQQFPGVVESGTAADSFTITKLEQDNIIGIEGFEKYGPAINASLATFSNSTSNINGNQAVTQMRYQGFFQEWLSIGTGVSTGIGFITGRAGGSSKALAIVDFSGWNPAVTRAIPTNYQSMIFGFAFVSGVGNPAGIGFGEAGVGTQCSLWVDSSGRVNFNRGGINAGTNLYQSSALFTANSWHYLEVGFTISNTVGQFSIWLDGNLLTSSAANQNTRGASNNYVNYFYLQTMSTRAAWDDMYWRDNTRGTATALGDCTVDPLPVVANDTVQFTASTSILGDRYIMQTNVTNAPGANQLALVAVTPAVNMTINSVGCLPQATNLLAKFKGVIYSDNAGSPGSLLSSGIEVIGVNTAQTLTLPLVTPQALTGGTQYWIGFITDSSVVMQQTDNFNFVGQKKANTYTSGAPAGPLSGMTTGQSTWSFWGNCTNGTNYDVVNKVPSPIIQSVPVAYTSSSTVGQKDYYTATALAVTPNKVHSVKISVLAQRSDTGPRTMNVRAKSGTGEGIGTIAAITPGTSAQWYSSCFHKNPDTQFEWGVGAVNTIKIGYEVAT